MVTFGIEGIADFSNSRKNGFKRSDLGGVFAICNEFGKVLRRARHTQEFYYDDTLCEERDLRAREFKGQDYSVADNVDLFLIVTHGGHDDDDINLAFDTKKACWNAYSKDWILGDKKLKWLMMYSCSTIDKKNYESCWNIFHNLHEICGAYGPMWFAPSTAESGENVAENLIDGKTVADAWLEGVSDWAHNNRPIVVAADDGEGTLNTLDRDHLPGHGYSIPDNLMRGANTLTAKWVEATRVFTSLRELF